MRRMRCLLFFFRGCVECPASVGGNLFSIKRLTSPSLCFGEASVEFGSTVLLSGSACACVRLCPMLPREKFHAKLCYSLQKSRLQC